MPLQGLENQLRRNMDVLEQIFAKHEEFLEKLSSAIAKYVEVAGIAKPLVEAAGAEIESRGRASKRTVYGKLRKRFGKGIVQYLSEKTWTLSMLMHFIGTERKLASEQARFLYSTLRTTDLELHQEEAEEKKMPKQLRAKIKKVEKLTRQCEKILSREAARDKKLISVTNKELAALRKAHSLSMKEGVYARGLTRIFLAPMYLKKLELVFEKEEIFFAKFMKEENWIVDAIALDMKLMFKLIKDHEKIEKLIGGRPRIFRREEQKAKKEARVSKRIKKLMKSLQKIQKHLEKVKKGAAKYGVKVSRTVSMINAEERALLKEEEDLEKEFARLDRLFENMQRFSTMISRFINNISTAEIRLKPQIMWINNALLSAYKIAKKNPSGALNFLEKVAQFSQKALIPALQHIDEERRELFKEFAGEEGIIKNLERDMQMMYILENKGFLKNLKKLDKNLLGIEKSVDAGTKRAIRDLRADIRELEESLKEEKIIVKEEAQAGAPKTTQEEAETRAKIAELRMRIRELQTKHKDMKREFLPAINAIKKAISEAPHFNFTKKGLFGIFGKNVEDRMIKDIVMAEHYLSKEEKEESMEILRLKKWIENKTDLMQYVAFINTLRRGFEDEGLMLYKLIAYYRNLALMEKDFSAEVRKSEKCMIDIERGISNLEAVMLKYTDLFGEEEKRMITELKEILVNANRLVGELKKTENALIVFAHSLPQVEYAIERAKENVIELRKITKISIKNAKKASKFFGKEIQAKL